MGPSSQFRLKVRVLVRGFPFAWSTRLKVGLFLRWLSLKERYKKMNKLFVVP